MAQIITGHRIGQDGTLRVGCSAAIFDEKREKILHRAMWVNESVVLIFAARRG